MYSNRTRDPDRRRRRCFHANFTTPGLTKWCRRKQGVSCTRCCSYFGHFLRFGYNRRDPPPADPSQHGACDGKQKSYQSKSNIPPHVQNPATSKRPYAHPAGPLRGGGLPSPTWAEGPGRRTPNRTTGPDRKRRVSNCILRPLATLRPSPVAFATIYRGRLGGRVGASPLRNRDRKQAPGAEVSPVALTLDRGRLRRPELLPRASDMVPHWPSMSFGFCGSPLCHTPTPPSCVLLVRRGGARM